MPDMACSPSPAHICSPPLYIETLLLFMASTRATQIKCLSQALLSEERPQDSEMLGVGIRESHPVQIIRGATEEGAFASGPSPPFSSLDDRCNAWQWGDHSAAMKKKCRPLRTTEMKNGGSLGL